jgi:anhydro-N-acetylmuramic acid kinase
MTEPKVYTAIGLMSGTSLDGVDCALIRTDGRGFVEPLAFVTIPYQPGAREEIRACFGVKSHHDPKVLAAAKLVTRKHIEAIRDLLHGQGMQARDVDLIGFHGQTIYHAPAERMTVQIGDGDLMARECGIDVIDDFRSADVRAGGEGAPLAPLYHAARLKSAKIELPAVILNIGGVANVTYIDEDTILAFDTGPGNALMDDWMQQRTGARYDEDGRCASAGRVHGEYLKLWFAHPYFMRKPPKSLDRDQWDIAALGRAAQGMQEVSTEDGAATLLAFTAEAIARSTTFMPKTPAGWYACGGGRHNMALMTALNDRLDGRVRSVDDLGWDGDATEAECFAYLAVRSALGLPISLPTTTNAPQPMSGGTLHKH